MVFKQKDSEDPQVRALELRVRQSSDAKERARLEKTLAMLWAGVKGEKLSAYHIDFVLKDSPNWAVIHDLRIELNGRVAQIDHILINRFLEIYVIESKCFRTKILYANGGRERLNSSNYWEGIESPVEQNENHIFVLKDLIDTHQLAPTRFGLSPNFINIVSIQGSCSIIGKLPAKTKVERVDSLVRKLQKQEPSILWLLKIISPETLHAFAKTLVTYHQPVEPLQKPIALRDAPRTTPPQTTVGPVPSVTHLCRSPRSHRRNPNRFQRTNRPHQPRLLAFNPPRKAARPAPELSHQRKCDTAKFTNHASKGSPSVVLVNRFNHHVVIRVSTSPAVTSTSDSIQE